MESGVILNHADGGVTAGYSHGDPRCSLNGLITLKAGDPGGHGPIAWLT
jgi:hypothetical protein